jgi:hypothetical protein
VVRRRRRAARHAAELRSSGDARRLLPGERRRHLGRRVRRHYIAQSFGAASAERRAPRDDAGGAGPTEPAPRRPPTIQLSLPRAPAVPRSPSSSKEWPS